MCFSSLKVAEMEKAFKPWALEWDPTLEWDIVKG
jgi:hypothetical protein